MIINVSVILFCGYCSHVDTMAASIEFPHQIFKIDLSKAHEQVGKVFDQGVQWNKEPAKAAGFLCFSGKKKIRV